MSELNNKNHNSRRPQSTPRPQNRTIVSPNRGQTARPVNRTQPSSNRTGQIPRTAQQSPARPANRAGASPNRTQVPRNGQTGRTGQARQDASRSLRNIEQEKFAAQKAKPKIPPKAPVQQRDHDQRLAEHKKKIINSSRKREHSLCAFNVAVLLTIFGFITLFMTFGKRPNAALEENRDLAKMPAFSWKSYFSGEFTSAFAEFYNDTVPMRSTFKTIISEFDAKLGLNYGGAEIHGELPVIDNGGKDNTSGTTSKIPPTANLITSHPESTKTPQSTVSGSNVQSTGSTQSTPESSSEESQHEQPEVNPADHGGEMSGTVLVLDDGTGISLFGGSFKGGEFYAGILNKYKQQVGDGVNVYSMVAPTSGSFYLPAKFKGYMASEWDNIENINSFLDGVIPVDVYTALSKHVDEHIYSRTDHHWQHLGAYYAAEALAKEAGVPFAPLSDYEAVSRDGYVGTMYMYSDWSKTIRDHPENFTYYKPQNSYETEYYDNGLNFKYTGNLLLNIDNLDTMSWYLVFIGTDDIVTHVTTDCKNGRKLLIVKDSYGNATIPCYTNSFEEIWMVDMRYFKQNLAEFTKDKGITDTVFTMCSFSAVGGNAADLKNMIY